MQIFLACYFFNVTYSDIVAINSNYKMIIIKNLDNRNYRESR